MKPRHYALIALLIAIAIFDFVRMHRRATMPASNAVTTAPSAQIAWAAFDKAASLRDANDTAFQAALQPFDEANAKVTHRPGNYAAQDLESCRIWLLQYRKGTGMHALASEHVNSCTKLHRDVAR